MTTAHQTIAEGLRLEMIKIGATRAWSGVPDLMLRAYERTGGKIADPFYRIKAVLDAARRSNLFVFKGYIRAMDSLGAREILHPVFELSAPPEPQQEQPPKRSKLPG